MFLLDRCNNHCSDIVSMVGKRIQVEWKMSDGTYEWFDGIVQSCSDNGSEAIVEYGDGDCYILNTNDDVQWRPMPPNTTAAAATAGETESFVPPTPAVFSDSLPSSLLEKAAEASFNKQCQLPPPSRPSFSSRSPVPKCGKRQHPTSSNEVVSKKIKKPDMAIKHCQIPPLCHPSFSSTSSRPACGKHQKPGSSNEIVFNNINKAIKDCQLALSSSPSFSSTNSRPKVVKRQQPVSSSTTPATKSQEEDYTVEMTKDYIVGKKRKKEEPQPKRSKVDRVISKKKMKKQIPLLPISNVGVDAMNGGPQLLVFAKTEDGGQKLIPGTSWLKAFDDSPAVVKMTKTEPPRAKERVKARRTHMAYAKRRLPRPIKVPALVPAPGKACSAKPIREQVRRSANPIRKRSPPVKVPAAPVPARGKACLAKQIQRLRLTKALVDRSNTIELPSNSFPKTHRSLSSLAPPSPSTA